MKFGLRYASLGRYSNGPAAVELAQAAEAAGFDSIWTVEHVVVPHGYQSRYPYSPTGRMGSGLEDFPIPDPLIWLANIASATSTIKLGDRKSTRLNSSHSQISYAVFCLKKKKNYMKLLLAELFVTALVLQSLIITPFLIAIDDFIPIL